MLVKNCFRKLIASFTAVAVLCVSSSIALAQTKDVAGEITVTGQVTVNGQAAVSNSTIISGSTVVTGPTSNAIISLGKSGRVEVLADSNIILNFSDNSITANLVSGKAKFSNAAGVATTVATKDATAIADSGQANNFSVEVECSHTHIDTVAGMVTMREGTSDKQIAAGTSATAGNLAQTGCKPCLRPNSAPPVPIGGWPWLLLIAAGVAGAAIFLGGNDNEGGGGTVVVSPVR
jgi:ferric-dicitrate binding protein FerR (iron transport regulator)